MALSGPFLVMERTGTNIEWYTGKPDAQTARQAAADRAVQEAGRTVEIWARVAKVESGVPPLDWTDLR